MRIAGKTYPATITDAVRLCSGRIAAAAKVATSPDVESELVAALARVRGAGPVARVHVGTTAFTNTLLQRRDLAPAAAIRVGAPVSESLSPMIDWPHDLRAAAPNPIFFVRGGREYDGRPIRPLECAEIDRVAATLATSGVMQAAVTAMFGTSYPDDELSVADWLREANPDLGVSLSHRIERFGILERENATLLNAMLRRLATRTVAGYRAAVSDVLFVSQNDGTVMRADRAAELPVFTLASGPTNSLRGAAMLTAVEDAIVFDVGGTTTDVGLLRGGYPQLAGLDLEVAGVRTNFRMPRPVWTPMPMRSTGSPRAARAAFSCASSFCMASAQRTARSAWSGCATGAPTYAMMPSPRYLSSVPPWAKSVATIRA
jgi:N-methylhydantoinase A/oxoprolinase/acetone carboxylase beta subunit